jgi:hypothetical protein
MKQIFFLLLCCVFYISCDKKPNDQTGLSEDDLSDLIKREKANEDRAKYGSVKDVKIISDPNEVTKIKKEISAKIEQQKKRETTLAEKYKNKVPGSLQKIIEVLKSNDKDAKRELYSDLQELDREPGITEPELIKVIFDNIEKPSDEENAIQLAGYTKIPGYVEKFESRLLSGKSKDTGRLLFWLSSDGTSKKALGYISSVIERGVMTKEEKEDITTALQYFSERGTPETKKMAGELALTILRKKIISSKDFNKNISGAAGNLLMALYTTNDPEVIAIAEQCLAKKIREEEALNYLIKVKGVKYKDQVFSLLQDKDEFINGLEPATELYKITKDKMIAKEILVQFESRGEFSKYELQRIAVTFMKMGATEYFSKLSEFIKSKKLINSLTETYNLEKMTIKEVADDLYSMGLFEKPISKEFIQGAIKESEEEPGNNIHAILEASNQYLWFDTETGFVPVDYDKLIMDFAKKSNGKLKDILVTMETSGDPGTEGDLHYKISLYFNNKIYVIEPEDIGDWYDVGMVEALLNKVLEDSGAKERYVFIETGDQTAQYLFGEEDKVKAVVKKYHLD